MNYEEINLLNDINNGEKILEKIQKINQNLIKNINFSENSMTESNNSKNISFYIYNEINN